MNFCTDCGHSWFQHSREPGVGCLHSMWVTVNTYSTWGSWQEVRTCPCTEPGDSPAYQ